MIKINGEVKLDYRWGESISGSLNEVHRISLVLSIFNKLPGYPSGGSLRKSAAGAMIPALLETKHWGTRKISLSGPYPS